MSVLSLKKENKGSVRICAPFIYILLASLFLLSGCLDATESTLKDSSATPKVANDKALEKVTEANLVDNKIFAPTVLGEKKGQWLGGPPPLNKQASGINTFYRIKQTNKSGQLKVTLRFEEVIAEDAVIEFKVIDGARFMLENQQSRWRLKPNTASEISFNVFVPDNVSYLSINTFQNDMGASRAFILKTSNK